MGDTQRVESIPLNMSIDQRDKASNISIAIKDGNVLLITITACTECNQCEDRNVKFVDA